MTTANGRLLALGRAETTLLLRNRTALFMAVAMPLCMVAGLRGLLKAQAAQLPGIDLNAALVLNVTGITLLFVVYYNLTAAYVARRGELVLKRMRTGELSDGEILAGTALPSVLLALVQSVLVAGATGVLLNLSAPANPLLSVAGLALAIAVLVPLAALSSAFTRTVETAGITTLPVLLLTMAGSGLLVPYSVMPEWLAIGCRLLPTSSAFQVLRIGWLGTDGTAPVTGFGGTWAPALPYLAGGVAWALATAWAARRWFRWEPRR
ncbi:ABC transporter permease [Kitasatospora sp. MAP5-34]|uniref:ABC transporter permease n=1 Tax=Kitasatospora sp. MAP5-34 TaxID=3035102 RepID=UPI0024739199|nr:ABC transporter permease [Kitasatospora sp. MAP5-34]MDH6580357.1 ABC-2 type transport system permease protein [Kitasatospora sp. MAP5-34]